MRNYKLGRKKSNRAHLVKNLVTSLLAYERITTTLPKAKLTQAKAEHIINRVLKSNDLNGYRYALKETGQVKVAKKLIEVTKKQYTGSTGGYTRILNIGNRKGDNAPMVILEMTKKIEVVAPAKTDGSDKSKSDKNVVADIKDATKETKNGKKNTNS